MTSQGHPYATFRRALERRVLPATWAAAHDVGRINVADTLELALLVAEQEPDKYPRVAPRWHSRYCAEGVTLSQAQAALALLAPVDESEASAMLRETLRR